MKTNKTMCDSTVKTNTPASVCYILSYYSPNYARTATLIGALSDCKEIKLFQARNKSTGIARYIENVIQSNTNKNTS